MVSVLSDTSRSQSQGRPPALSSARVTFLDGRRCWGERGSYELPQTVKPTEFTIGYIQTKVQLLGSVFTTLKGHQMRKQSQTVPQQKNSKIPVAKNLNIQIWRTLLEVTAKGREGRGYINDHNNNNNNNNNNYYYYYYIIITMMLIYNDNIIIVIIVIY